MKAQLIVDLESHKILSTCAGQGRTHDYKLYQNSDTKIADNTEIHVDLGLSWNTKSASNREDSQQKNQEQAPDA